MKEAQISAHPSQVRRADVCGCRLAGHLLGSLLGLLAAVLTARLVLMTSGSRLLASVASAAPPQPPQHLEDTAETTEGASSYLSMVAIRLDFWQYRAHSLELVGCQE